MPMTDETFRKLLSAYGHDLARWPAATQTAARAFLSAGLSDDPGLQKQWQEEMHLDRKLRAFAAPGPSPEAFLRIAELPQEPATLADTPAATPATTPAATPAVRVPARINFIPYGMAASVLVAAGLAAITATSVTNPPSEILPGQRDVIVVSIQDGDIFESSFLTPVSEETTANAAAFDALLDGFPAISPVETQEIETEDETDGRLLTTLFVE